MTRITKLKLKNFKSFKKAEIPFADGFTAIAGANASGKCVIGETRVMLSSGESVKIGDLVKQKLKETKVKKILDDGVVGFNSDPDFKIYSLNPETLKTEEKIVTAIIERKTPARLVKVKTRGGKEITTTDYHPFFSINQNGIYSLKASELKEKQFIATPRKISSSKKELFLKEFIDIIEPSDSIFIKNTDQIKSILKEYKKATGHPIKRIADEFKVPKNSLNSLMQGQAINFSHAMKLLKGTGHSPEIISELITKIKGKTSTDHVSMVWKNSPELSRLLGYLFAEGSVSGKNIRIVTERREIIEDMTKICEKVFGKKPAVYKYKENAFDIILNSHPAYALLSKFGTKIGANAKTKKIDSLFFKHSNEREFVEFLNGYLSGDGYVSRDISSVTASKELALDIKNIYLHLGIHAIIRKVIKGKKKVTYFDVVVTGAANVRLFSQKIKLIHSEKQKKIAAKNLKRPHTNTDIIPNINNLIKEACVEEGIFYAREKNKNVKLKSYTDNACFPSRTGLKEVIDNEFQGKSGSKTTLLQQICDSDIFWDQIVSIEDVEKKPSHVYDLSIDKNHNFIANDFFVHNSNILDSLLFALGMTSLKMLRASRLTELVNHDSKEGYAKVELTINNEGNEIVLDRIIDLNGKSVYRVDGKRKALNEVQSLLLELGIKPTGHNIVVQGDITKVIEMNAKQRRQVIEEAAGLQEFEEKKQDALKKLEKVEQRIKDTDLVMKERESYLEQLQQERENALRYNELQEEAKSSKATILAEEIRIIKKELEESRKSIERLREEIEKKRDERQGMQEEERELERKVDAATQRLIEAGEKTYSGLGKEVEKKRSEISIFEERENSRRETLSNLDNKKKYLEEGIETVKRDMDEKEKELGEEKKGLGELKERLRELREKIDSINPVVEESRGKERPFEEKKEKIENEIGEIREELHSLKIDSNILEKEIEYCENNLKELKKELSIATEKIEEKRLIEREIMELEKESPETKVEEAEAYAEELRERLHKTKAFIHNLGVSLDALGNAKASCPTCDKPLEKHTKSQLSEHKSKEREKLEKEQEELSVKIDEFREKRKKLEEQVKKLNSLKQKIEHYNGFEGREKELREKISNLENENFSEKILELKEKESALNKKLESLISEKGNFEKEIRELREKSGAGEMNSLLNKLNEINEEISEKQEKVMRLETQTRQVLKEKKESMEKQLSNLREERENTEKQLEEINSEKEKIREELSELENELERQNKENKVIEDEKNRLAEKIGRISEKRDKLGEQIEAREKEMNEINIEQSRNEVRIADLEEEYKDFEQISIYEKFDLQELKKRIPEIEKEIEKLGAINMKALEGFENYKREVEDVREKAEKLDWERKAVLEMIDKIEVRKLNVFMDCFNHVSRKFSELYYNFFEGEGVLELNDKESPLDGGLLIQAKYKEDTMKSIDAMSGGEKSLTALAFLFSIQSFEPAPFYILDEVDAALDKENSLKVGKIVKENSKNSQFISISHNEAVINQADQIIGVALNKQKSSVIGLRLAKQT